MTSTEILGCEDRIELLSRRLDGDLSPAEMRELDLHLESCPACRETLALLGGTVEAVTAASVPPPETLAPKVMARLRDEGLVGVRQRPPAKLFFFRQAPMLAAAAIVVLAAGTVILLRTRGVDQTSLLEKGLDEAAGRAPAREALPEAALPAPDLSAPAAPPPATMPIGRDAKEQPMLKSADDALAGAKRSPAARGERDRGAAANELAPSPSAGGGSYAAEKKVAQNAPPRESGAAMDEPAPSQQAKGDSRELHESLPLGRSYPSAPAAAPAPVESRADKDEGKLAAAKPAAEAPRRKSEATAAEETVAGAPSGELRAQAAAKEKSSEQERQGYEPAANWRPGAGMTWDYPPRWTEEASRVISRIRGARVALQVTFSRDGKVISATFVSGDRRRAEEIIRNIRALDQALVPARRGRELVAGVGRVEMDGAGM